MLIRTSEFRDYYLIQIYYVIKIINSFLAKDSKCIKESVQVETCPWIYLEISTIFQNYIANMGAGNSRMYILPFTMDEF